MASTNSIKIIAIKHKKGRQVNLDLLLGSERATYDVSIVDRDGIFGLELPEALGLKLRNFPPADARNFVAAVKREMAKNLVAA